MSLRREVLILYKNLLRASSTFDAYNYRLYAIRRVKDHFRANLNVTDSAIIKQLIEYGNENLTMIKRQVLVGQLYATDKLIIERNGI